MILKQSYNGVRIPSVMLGIVLLLAHVSILPIKFGQKFVADAKRILGTFLAHNILSTIGISYTLIIIAIITSFPSKSLPNLDKYNTR